MQKVDRLDQIIKEEAFENCGISCNVLRAYCESIDRNLDEIDFSFITYETKISEIVENLRACGVKSFTLSDQSTALMSELHEFLNAGCKLVGSTEVRMSAYPNHRTKQFDMKLALKFQIID